MSLAVMTQIPVHEWRREMVRDPRIVATAIAEAHRQNKPQDEDPGAGGPSRKTLYSG